MAEDVTTKAAEAFEGAQASHALALDSLNAKDFLRAIEQYQAVLSLMSGNHPATQYYLGTCQLDYGDAISGVKNISEALAADAANFDPSAWQRLAAGKSMILMHSSEEACGQDARSKSADSKKDNVVACVSNHKLLVNAWDDVFSVSELIQLDTAARHVDRFLKDQATSSTIWYARDRAPRNDIEAAISRLEPLVKSFAANNGLCDMSCLNGCEYWVRFQTNRRGVASHYDMDVGSKRRGKVLLPVVSSILYLTGAGESSSIGAGPTVVLSQRPSSAALSNKGDIEHAPSIPSVGEFVWPRRGRYAVFEGNLHHGVMPADDDDQRVTVLVNWWLTPNMSPRHSNCAQAYEHETFAASWSSPHPVTAIEPLTVVVPSADQTTEPLLPLRSRLGFLEAEASLPVPSPGRPAIGCNGFLRVFWS